GPDAAAIPVGARVSADLLPSRGRACTPYHLPIEGNQAQKGHGVGFFLEEKAAYEMIENVTVRDLHVVRTKGAGIKGHSTPSGPANRRSLVQSCIVDDTDGEGIALVATDQSIVANCFVSRTGKHGIISTQGNENTVLGNHILQAGLNKSSGFAHGIAIDGNGGSNPNAHHRVIGNYVLDACDAGIEVADGVSDLLIEGNTINGAGV